MLSTLHTQDAAETVNRVVDFFPPHEQQQQVRIALARSLRGVVSQRLVRRADGAVRAAAVRAIGGPSCGEPLAELVAQGGYAQMQTFDQHLSSLVTDGTVDAREALGAASNPHDLTVKLRACGLLA